MIDQHVYNVLEGFDYSVINNEKGSILHRETEIGSVDIIYDKEPLKRRVGYKLMDRNGKVVNSGASEILIRSLAESRFVRFAVRNFLKALDDEEVFREYVEKGKKKHEKS